MTVEQTKKTNREIVEIWQEIIDSKIFDKLETVEDLNVININPAGTFKGMRDHREMLNAYAVAFPNYKHDNFNYIESGEWIAMEGIFTGDNTGAMTIGGHTLPATNKKVKFPYSGFIKIRDGKVVENRLYYDSKTFLSQLGL